MKLERYKINVKEKEGPDSEMFQAVSAVTQGGTTPVSCLKTKLDR